MGRKLNPFLRLVAKDLFLFVLMVLACRVTKDFFAFVVVFYGVYCALSNKPGKAIVLFLALPFGGMINPILFPRTGIYMIAARGGMVGMTLAMLVGTQSRRGRNVLPLGSLGLYVVTSAVSSLTGYEPTVSYLKLVSFAFFITGLVVGTRNLHERPADLLLLRAAMFAFACIVIFGSLMTLPFPSIAYFVSLKGAITDRGVDEALAMYQTSKAAGGMHLLSGIVFHSQALSPLLACLAGWVFCDMVVIEKRLAKIHMALLGLTPVLMYLTRSRLALLCLVVLLLTTCGYCFPHLKIEQRVRGKMRSFLLLSCAAIIVGGIIFEFRDQGLTKWVRKTNDIETDKQNRSAVEAFSATRMGAIDNGLYDFRKNPMWGMGFQVAEYTPVAIRDGWATWYSAPIEKSLLPMIVIGEGGLVGSVAFLIFLVCFFGICHSKGYHITITLFILFLTTNLAEGTFFSINALGGVLWLVTVVGGFALDTIIVYRRGLDRMLRQQRMEWGMMEKR